LRYLQSLLRPEIPSAPRPSATADGGREDVATQGDGGDIKVLLVSLLRDFAFWKEGAARLGIDLEGLGRRGRFGFVDGLSQLFLNGNGDGKPAIPAATAAVEPEWKKTLASAKVPDVGRVLDGVIDGLRSRNGGRVVLVVDQLDFLLAATGADVTGLGLRELLLDLREVRSSDDYLVSCIV